MPVMLDLTGIEFEVEAQYQEDRILIIGKKEHTVMLTAFVDSSLVQKIDPQAPPTNESLHERYAVRTSPKY